MKVFVYGSLCNQERHHDFMKNAVCLAEQASVKGRLYSGASYSPLLVQDDLSLTYGELYEINAEILEHLDKQAGYTPSDHRSLFVREETMVYTEDGETEAYVYYWPHTPLGDAVRFNDWKVTQFLQKETFFYFAYGSCMDDARLIAQKVDHLFKEVKGRGVLAGYRLGFSHHLEDGGRADIIESTGHSVEGVVYEISTEALQYLYRREGVEAGGYRPTVIDLTLDDGTIIQALSFTVLNKKTDLPPPFHYAQEIHRGGSFYLSSDYLSELEHRFLNDLKVNDFHPYLQNKRRQNDSTDMA